MSKEYKLTVEFHNGARYCYYGKTKKEALSEFRKSFGSFRGFIKKEWEIIINNYGNKEFILQCGKIFRRKWSNLQNERTYKFRRL